MLRPIEGVAISRRVNIALQGSTPCRVTQKPRQIHEAGASRKLRKKIYDKYENYKNYEVY